MIDRRIHPQVLDFNEGRTEERSYMIFSTFKTLPTPSTNTSFQEGTLRWIPSILQIHGPCSFSPDSPVKVYVISNLRHDLTIATLQISSVQQYCQHSSLLIAAKAIVKCQPRNVFTGKQAPWRSMELDFQVNMHNITILTAFTYSATLYICSVLFSRAYFQVVGIELQLKALSCSSLAILEHA